MNRSTFWMIKYMNGSIFSKTRYMNGVGFEILARTPVPKLPLSYPPEMPASVAQSDVRPTGDQVAGSVATGSVNSFLWRLVILSFPLIQEGQLSKERKSVRKYWLTA